MKKVVILFIILLTAEFVLSQNRELNSLVYKKQFLKLDNALKKQRFLSEDDKLIYTALYLSALGKSKESNDIIIRIKGKSIPYDDSDSLQFYLCVAEYSNYVRLFYYKKAFETSRVLLSKYTHFLNDDELKGEVQSAKIWECLNNSPAQTAIKTDDSYIPITRDIAELDNIPVTMNDTTCNFLFDTGAGFSTISETYAQKLNVNSILNSNIGVKSGVTGISTDVHLGLAKQIVIGNLVVSNAVFLIVPDSTMSFAGGKYVINGVIGLPIIMAFNEFSITKGVLNIPKKIGNLIIQPNMALDFLKPIIYMSYNEQSLPFTFDTGANSTTFNDIFYELDKHNFDRIGRLKEFFIGGAGGTIKQKQLVVPNLPITVSNIGIVIKEAELSKEQIHTNGNCYYGNVGHDIIDRFEKMTISFVNAYIHFE